MKGWQQTRENKALACSNTGYKPFSANSGYKPLSTNSFPILKTKTHTHVHYETIPEPTKEELTMKNKMAETIGHANNQTSSRSLSHTHNHSLARSQFFALR